MTTNTHRKTQIYIELLYSHTKYTFIIRNKRTIFAPNEKGDDEPEFCERHQLRSISSYYFSFT